MKPSSTFFTPSSDYGDSWQVVLVLPNYITPQHNRMCNVSNWDGKFALTHDVFLPVNTLFLVWVSHYHWWLGMNIVYSLIVTEQWRVFTFQTLKLSTTNEFCQRSMVCLSVCLSTRLGYCVEMMIVRCGMDCTRMSLQWVIWVLAAMTMYRERESVKKTQNHRTSLWSWAEKPLFEQMKILDPAAPNSNAEKFLLSLFVARNARRMWKRFDWCDGWMVVASLPFNPIGRGSDSSPSPCWLWHR